MSSFQTVILYAQEETRETIAISSWVMLVILIEMTTRLISFWIIKIQFRIDVPSKYKYKHRLKPVVIRICLYLRTLWQLKVDGHPDFLDMMNVFRFVKGKTTKRQKETKLTPQINWVIFRNVKIQKLKHQNWRYEFQVSWCIHRLMNKNPEYLRILIWNLNVFVWRSCSVCATEH